MLEDISREMKRGSFGGVSSHGMVGRGGTKTNGANVSRESFKEKRKERSATKDGNLSVTDKRGKQYTVHNGTFPAFEHSSTRKHAFYQFLSVAQKLPVDQDSRDQHKTVPCHSVLIKE